MKIMFSKWFDGKFGEWRKEQTYKESDQRDFAKWLGLSYQNVNHYLAGRHTPKGKNLDKIADKLGLEAYDAAGEPRPDERLKKIIQMWPQLSDEKREWLVSEAEIDAEQNVEQAGEGVAKDE